MESMFHAHKLGEKASSQKSFLFLRIEGSNTFIHINSGENPVKLTKIFLINGD